MKSEIVSSFAFEEKARKKGFQAIAGVDEAGRGPLAGPVVAAACILPFKKVFFGLNDSKKLSLRDRERLFQELVNDSEVVFGVGVVEADHIDQLNIHRATLLAMKMAVEKLVPIPDYLLVDGLHVPDIKISANPIPKGDALSQSISAASVIAKVTRDDLMVKYHYLYPAYGFDQHKGYGTPEHLAAIAKHGPCSIHRKSFEPVQSYNQLKLF